MYDRQLNTLVDYFKSHQKQPGDLKIGAELEHFAVHSDLSAVTYFEDMGIEHILKEMNRGGWTPTYEAGHLVGLAKEEATITLEPGGQLELSTRPCSTLAELHREYETFLGDILPILDNNDQHLVAMGYQPVSGIDEIPWIPKERYRLMSAYFARRGPLAHNMMKGTGAVHVAIDYTGERDFIDKYDLACRLSFVIPLILDNAPIFQSEIYMDHCLRTRIWSQTDSDRCGIAPFVFTGDLSFEKYAHYLLEMVPIVVPTQGGELTPCDVPFKDIFDLGKPTDGQIEYMLSMCFPDVRLKQYIEIRMADAMPYPYNLAYPAFIKGVFYDDAAFGKARAVLSDLDLRDVSGLMGAMIDRGLDLVWDGRPVLGIIERLTEIAAEGLPADEVHYLEPLIGLVSAKTNLAALTREALQHGVEKALAPQLISPLDIDPVSPGRPANPSCRL